jgi:hypothetical protein
MRWPATGGLAWAGRGPNAGFATPVANASGNNLPGITGALPLPARPAPGPGGDSSLGAGDPFTGADPRVERIQPDTRQAGINFKAERGREMGAPGFNDKLTVKDRHGYWDTGQQKTGTEFQVGYPANAYNNPRTEPPRPDFRLVNRTISYQKGSDATRNQDDLGRAYTWLGEQGSGWTPVYGGVPGLYQPYGSRGGYPYPVVSPVEQGQPGDGPHLVFSGPPHGLHSQTPWKGGAQIISRFMNTPQTRPVRQDRPSNSPQAGQSYSQTVLPQGASRVRPRPGAAGSATVPAGPASAAWLSGRGWAGQWKPSVTGADWRTAMNR